VRHELIYHDAGAETPEILSVDEICRLIREAGREPVERDTLYHRVVREGTTWKTAEAIVAAQASGRSRPPCDRPRGMHRRRLPRPSAILRLRR